MNLRSCTLCIALACLAVPAAAQTRWYGGVALGASSTSSALVRNRESTVTLASDFDTDFDSHDGAYKATLGYKVLPWLAIEADYTDLGKHSLLTNFMGGDAPAPAAIYLERRVRGFGLDALASFRIAPQWKGYGRVGAFEAKLDARQALGGNVVFTGGDPNERERSTKQTETVLRWGLGTQFEITDCTWLRLEWTRHEKIGKAFRVGGSGTTGEADTDVVLVGLLYNF